MTVTSTNQKVQFTGNGSATVFAYNFKIFAQTDLSVILRSAAGTETPQQLSTKYTVSGVGVASGGNVTMGTAPPAGTTLTILRVQPNLQGLDLVPNDPFPAGSMEDALDKLTFMVQTHDEEIRRSIRASPTNVITGSEFTVSATDRANKLFSFDSSGNLSIAQELGTFRGNWAANTAYAVRDLVKDTSTGNIFIVITAHTSSGSQPITTNTDAAKWSLIVDAASATTSKNAAAASATASANSATASSNSATTSGNSATTSGNSATASGNSATAAGNSATAAGNSATAAAASLTTFTQQYHGAASSDPSSNLSTGDLYFKTGGGGGMRVYNGSAWVAAAFDVSGALINTNNLSDVSSAATALANLGVSSTAAELNKLDALSRGSLIYGNASAATAVLTKGSANTFLKSDGTDLAWAAVSSAYSAPTIPNWANPTNTYTSSGTWSKGSLADNAVVWIYMIGGGSGGWSAPDPIDFGSGGFCRIIVGTAADFNGGAYVIGAGGTAGANGGNPGKGGNGGNTTFTQASGVGNQGFIAYGGLGDAGSTTQSNDAIKGGGAQQVFSGANDAYIQIAGDGSVISAKLGVANVFLNLVNALTSSVQTSVFNGATRATMNTVNNTYVRTSLFGGNAGVSQFLPSGQTTTSTTAGSVPGGMGGCARVSNSNFSGAQPKAGGAGNVRVYHV